MRVRFSKALGLALCLEVVLRSFACPPKSGHVSEAAKHVFGRQFCFWNDMASMSLHGSRRAAL